MSEMLFDSVAPGSEELFREFQRSPHRIRQREHILRLWAQFRPYADRQFVHEFSRDFYGRYWEMVLGCALLDRGQQLVPTVSRPNSGPDLCIDRLETRIWVEAVAPRAGIGADAVVFSEDEGGLVPEEKIILRFTTAIEAKQRKLEGYREKNIVASSDPYVIAIGTRAIPGSLSETHPPFALQALYPVGPNSITIDVNTMEILNQRYAYRTEIRKLANTPVSTTFFLDQAYSGISAVVSGNPDLYEMNAPLLRVFHNPKAAAPLPLGWLPRGEEWWSEAGEVKRRWVE